MRSGVLLAVFPVLLLATIAFSDDVKKGTIVEPSFAPGFEKDWRFLRGQWIMGEDVLEQREPFRLASAFLKEPSFSDFTLDVAFKIEPVGPGVRAAAIILRATGTLTYYWLHLDSKNGNAILVRSTPRNTWIELGRVRCPLKTGIWHKAHVQCVGPEIRVAIDGKEILTRTDDCIAAGRIGLGTSQGRVLFRNLKISGKVEKMTQPLREEVPPYKVVSRGEAAGPYQAFPDICRLQNGDLLCVFYAGYGHVSLPNKEWPKGGRICMVRSRDDGRTWSEPEMLYDDELDNRDPHIAQLSNGTVVCSFFSLKPQGKRWTVIGAQIVRSLDGGKTWEKEATTLAPGWACSAPVRELPNGTWILGVYTGDGKGNSWGGIVRSTDHGKTWSKPIPIGKEAHLPLDAETDFILLKDGTLYAALRSSKINMHYATSKDFGLTWSPVKDIGFRGHAPHFTRLSTGEILLSHRVPETSLHVSRDECKTWQGPYIIDHVGGAYPSTVELKDGTVLIVYYEEGAGSAIRALRFRLKKDGIEPLPLQR